MPNTALNRTGVVSLTNKSGGDLTQGATVIVDSANANAFTTTTTSGYAGGQTGVIIEPNGIANNATGLVAFTGWIPKINLSGSASLGDLFKTHTVAGQSVRHATPMVQGDFGMVLATGTTPAAILFGVPNPGTVAAATAWKFPADGRLTLTTGVPVTTADVTAATTIYYTPYVGEQIALYDGASTWNVRTFAELSLSLAGFTTNTPYDIFCYDNGGTPTLEALIWTSDTARATALAYQNGILVKSGATTRRYLGTIRILATGQTEDSAINRLVWNYYHRVVCLLQQTDATASWSYNVASWRQTRAQAANQVAIINGVVEDSIWLEFHQLSDIQATHTVYAGIGINVTNANSALTHYQYGFTGSVSLTTAMTEVPRLGYSYYAMLEKNADTTALTRYGTAEYCRLHARWMK